MHRSSFKVHLGHHKANRSACASMDLRLPRQLMHTTASCFTFTSLHESHALARRHGRQNPFWSSLSSSQYWQTFRRFLCFAAYRRGWHSAKHNLQNRSPRALMYPLCAFFLHPLREHGPYLAPPSGAPATPSKWQNRIKTTNICKCLGSKSASFEGRSSNVRGESAVFEPEPSPPVGGPAADPEDAGALEACPSPPEGGSVNAPDVLASR